MQNIWTLILIFIENIVVVGGETLNVIFYRQVLLHLDKNDENKPWFNLITILLLLNKLIYNVTFRLYVTTSFAYSYRIITQLDTLIYNILLRTSLYANVSEGTLINFIQKDEEAF